MGHACAQGIRGDYNDAKNKAEKAKSLARDDEQIEMANDLLEMIWERNLDNKIITIICNTF